MIRQGRGEPLVLLHGVTGSETMWQSVIPLLAPHHDAIALTALGHRGGTPAAAGPPRWSWGLLDWQLMMRGSWAHDVTYLMVTALEPGVRRAHQLDLLSEYLDQLAAAGVDGVPSPSTALERCRSAALWGLVIGWLICPPDNYGQAITEANLSRAVTAVQDFDTFTAIEEWAG